MDGYTTTIDGYKTIMDGYKTLIDGYAPGVDRHRLAVQVKVERVGMPPRPFFCFQHGNTDVL